MQFEDSAMVLLGHGSSSNDRAALPVIEQARRISAANVFSSVHEAFWKQEPQIKTVMESVQAGRVFIVPMFVSDGYFGGKVIPRELGFDPGSRMARRGHQTIYYCGSVGTHPAITDLILERALGLLETFPFPRMPSPAATTLFVAGHGTEKDSDSRKSVEEHVEKLRPRKIFADCHAVFLEEKPGIADCYALAKTRNIVVIPLLIGEGDHTQKDIPRLLGEAERTIDKRLAANQPPWRNPTERQDKLVWYGSSLGLEPKLTDIILARAREAIEAPA